MRKSQKISFFGILGILTAVLFLASISFMQAQVQAKGKPDKPPGKPDKPGEEEATWEVQLPILGGGLPAMLYGDGEGNYSDQDKNIDVTVEKKKMSGPWKKDNDFYTRIEFKLSNPTLRYVDFEFGEGFSLQKLYEEDYPYVEPDYGKPCCTFPPPYYCESCLCDSCDCLCMQDFMNLEFHPYTNDTDPTQDYAFFAIVIEAFDQDILSMSTNEPYQLGQSGHEHDYIQLVLGYQTGNKEPTYHNIECSKSAHLGEASIHPFNIWITRTGENTWKVDVGTVGSQQFLFLEEYYYETITRGKKTKTEWFSTLYAGGDFYFTFYLIRIPTT